MREPSRQAASSSEKVWPRSIRRLLESFFRRPILTLLPFVALSSLGVYSVVGSEKRFVSAGVLSVSTETLLSNLTDVRVGEGFTWESPATVTSRSINELMSTDEFARTVAVGAGLGSALDDGLIELPDVRSSVGAFPTGSNLVRVEASTNDPELSMRLSGSTIEAFTEWVIEADIRQSSTAVEFFDDLLGSYYTEVQSSRAALDAYLAELPAGTGVRSPEQRAEINRLTARAELAEERYGRAVVSSEDARLATEQTRADVSQRLRVVDAPQMAGSAESSRKEQLLTVGMFMVAGLLFSIGLVVLGAVLDRSIRSADDVKSRLGRDVLAVVPDVRR